MGCGGRGSVGRDACSQGGSSVSEQRRARWTALERTAKPCGPDTRCWCQVARRLRQLNRAWSAANSPTTEARRIRLRGERGI